jgi:parvulin-like peptidyl-prolyl isomerase
VAPDAAVITIKGLCSTPGTKTATSRASATKASGSAASKPATCQTVITKKQLDRLIEAVRPNLPAQQRRMLAQQYVELLTMADAAAKAGVEKEPKVREQMRLQKLQILATSYSRELQQKYSDVPQADIEKYYKENASKYEQAKLQRIYIPMVTPEGKPPDAAATKIIAEKIQQRAAAGEDFDKLQKDAFAVAENKGSPPSVEMGERRRGTLPPRQEDTVFGLKAGEVSPALEETSGFYIYKVVGKETLPLDKVREEIKGILGRERFRDGIEKIRGSVQPTFNEAYFGGPAQPPAAPGESGAPPSTRPPGQEAVPPTAQTAAPPSGQTAAPPATPAPAPSGTPQAPNAPPPVPPK